MTRLTTAVCLTIVAIGADSALAAKPGTNQTPAVRARVDSYVAAFNRGDTATAADHWSDTAEYVLPDSGQRIRGRRAIRAALDQLINADDRLQLSVSGQSFRAITDTVVVEEGTARLVAPDHAPLQARYTAIHMKKNGKWYRDSVNEIVVPTAPSAEEQLESLAWMIGTWSSQDENGSLRLRCQWVHDKKYLSRGFEIRGKEGEKLSGTQTIGWDPSTGQLRSWTFDSEGGFEEAVWSRDGESWIVKVAAVLPDGRTGSEQRVITPADEKTFTWKAVQRQVDGALLPNSEKVTITRE